VSIKRAQIEIRTRIIHGPILQVRPKHRMGHERRKRKCQARIPTGVVLDTLPPQDSVKDQAWIGHQRGRDTKVGLDAARIGRACLSEGREDERIVLAVRLTEGVCGPEEGSGRMRDGGVELLDSDGRELFGEWGGRREGGEDFEGCCELGVGVSGVVSSEKRDVRRLCGH
jgi:hypothetical protein